MASQLMPSSSSTSALARGQTMGDRSVPSEFGQVLARFRVQEAGADHVSSGIAFRPGGKGVSRIPTESGDILPPGTILKCGRSACRSRPWKSMWV
jgi:hypothetical protein